MKFESIAECSPWSILQYFWPALSDIWYWKPICSLFESGRFTKYHEIVQVSTVMTLRRYQCVYMALRLYTENPDLTVANFMGNSIGLQNIKIHPYTNRLTYITLKMSLIQFRSASLSRQSARF